MSLDPVVIEKLEAYCAYQERCTQQVLDKLSKLDVPSARFDDHLHHLRTAGFLDDGRFAKAYASGRFNLKSWGPYRIRQGLKALRIPDHLIQGALSELESTELEERLTRLLERKMEQWSHLSKPAQRQRIVRSLTQKGYGMREVLDAWEAFCR